MNQRQINKYLKMYAYTYGCNPGETPRQALRDGMTWCRTRNLDRFCKRYVIEPDKPYKNGGVVKIKADKICGMSIRIKEYDSKFEAGGTK